MGDRASVQFISGGRESVVFCDHWGGEALHEAARDFAGGLASRAPDAVSTPLTRREPGHVMAAFIVAYGGSSSCYVEATRDEVDDTDNGCLFVRFGKSGTATFSKR